MRRALLVLLAFHVDACGGNELNLGQEDPPHLPPPRPTAPVRTADGGIDETVPWAIAPHQESPAALAIDATHLFWSSFTSVLGCTLSDCARSIKTYFTGKEYDGSSSVTVIAVNDGRVYWNTPGTVSSCPTDGCAGHSAEMVVDDPRFDTRRGQFLVDATHVYWAPRGTAIMRCLLSDCANTHETFAVLEGEPYDFASDASTLYVIVRGSSGETIDASVSNPDGIQGKILALDKEQPSPAHLIADAQHLPTSITVDGHNVYWANAYTQGTIATCPLTGCVTEPIILADRQATPARLAIDERNFYFVTAQRNASNALFECPLVGCGGSPRELASGSSTDGRGLVQDETHIYVTERGPYIAPRLESGYGDVLRVAK